MVIGGQEEVWHISIVLRQRYHFLNFPFKFLYIEFSLLYQFQCFVGRFEIKKNHAKYQAKQTKPNYTNASIKKSLSHPMKR